VAEPRTYRVVQWATGNIGSRAMRHVIDDPRLELVGLVVHAPDKVGVDAGELCGRPPTGVLGTSDLDDVLALGADCVLYMPQACDFDALCSILAAGTNVVTTRGELHHPASLDPEVRARIEAACAAGGTSIHGTGSSPGFITEAVPLVLASIQRRIDSITIDEYADLSQRPSPDLLFRVMGYGKAPEAFDPRRFAHGAQAFGPSLRVLAEALGRPLDEVRGSGEVAVATRDLEIAAGPIPAGTVAAQRMVVTGLRGGEPFLTFRTNWWCSAELSPAWELGDTGWRVQVVGDSPLDVHLRFDVPIEKMAETSPGFTANRAVNAIAAVCAAAPGIRTTVDLPHLIPNLAV
jgi:2,4-diaminopentanoate dehydrogenase